VSADVTANLAKYLSAPSFVAPGPSVNVPSLRGKRVFVVPLAETPFTQAVEAGEKAAAKAAGVQITFYPNQGQVSQWVQGMTTAISQKPDLIILDTAPDPRQLQPQIAAAKAAGIPVLVTHFYDVSMPGPPSCAGCAAGVTAVVKAPISTAGAAEADWIINDSHGKANVLMVSLNGLLPVPGMLAAANAEFAKYCPGCKVKTVSINLNQLATAGAFSQVSSALVQNPNLTYVNPLFDASVPGTMAAIQAAGKASKIRMIAFNGSSFALKDVASGTSPLRADVAEPDSWVGYSNMDQAFRVMTGMPAVTENTPIRLFDSSNISQAGGGPNYDTGYGDAYIQGFSSLWGLPAAS
jgi:ribose transport system substrate-binding protein